MGSKRVQKREKLSVTNLDNSQQLLLELKQLIIETRSGVAVAVNASLTLLYWRVGYRIHQDILAYKRADYGKEIVVTLARQLTEEYGRGFC